MTTATRAPKGGIIIMEVFYKGGQFLPTNEPQKGQWNSQSFKTTKAQKEIKEIKRQQMIITRATLVGRVMKMEKVWNSPKMTVDKNHPYAEIHAMETFEWHQRFGWADE